VYNITNELPIHGALDYAELARLDLRPDEILDFSVNSNPYGPSPRVREAIANVPLDRYPDRECLALRQAILAHELANYPLDLASIACGNGTSELIWTIAHTFLSPGQKAALVGPTFGEYAAASLAVGATVIEWRAEAESDFLPDVSALCAWLETEKPALLWLCNPNNPTGSYLAEHEITLIAETCTHWNIRLIIDEAYLNFVQTAMGSSERPFSSVALLLTGYREHILVLRSLTKDYALAGLRLGYIVGTVEGIFQVRAQLPSWNVNALAQVAGCAALADQTYLLNTLRSLAWERATFFEALTSLGIRIVKTSTHFCLLDVGEAAHVRQQLLLKKILVRDCTSFGLSNFIRVATRPQADWQKLVIALGEVMR
jgi:histidinol-phosphate aminotransferase